MASDREKLIELMQAAHDDFYNHFEPGKSYWETILDHLFANGVTVVGAETDLTGKCGSCEFAEPVCYCGSMRYVKCTNEGLLKSRPNRSETSAIRPRTNKGCKRYTPMPTKEG